MRPLRDDRLKFVEKTHKYKVGKQQLQGVTTWLSQFFPAFDAKEQARRSNKNPNSPYYKMGVRKILKAWEAKTLDGTVAHKQIEDYLSPAASNAVEPFRVDHPKAIHALPVIDDICERLELRPDQSYPEVRIYSEQLNLAGTVDWIVQTDSGLFLFDWKTNGDLKYSISKYRAQLNTYAYILEKEYGYPILGMRLVHLKEDGAEVIIVERDYARIEGYLKETNRL